MSNFKTGFLTVIIIFLTASIVFPRNTNYGKIINLFENDLPKIMKQENVRGVAIALTDKNKTFWSKTYGYTDDTKNFPITSNTNFSIQSATKTLTSLALLLAEQQGKISINDTVSKYLDDFTIKSIWGPSPENNITIRNLLNHTSGLTHETSVGNNYDLGYASFNEHVKSISNTWLQYPIGQRQHYSNLGMSLAGNILQAAMKKPYTESVRKLILNPIGMNSSRFISTKDQSHNNSAMGFSDHFDSVPYTPEGFLAAGGLYSNINDMSKFARFILNKGIVDGNRIAEAEIFRLLTKLPFHENGQIQGFGLGLEVKNFGGYEIYMMPGRGFGFMGGVVFFPEKEIALVVLTNNEDTSIPMFAISTLMQRLTQQNSNVTTSSFNIPGNTTKAPLKLIQEFEGEYLNAFNEPFVLDVEGNSTFIEINSESIEADIFTYNNELYAQTTHSVFRFIHDKEYNMKYVADVYDSEVFYDFNYSNKEEEKDLNAKWNKFIGSYRLEKWGVPYENIMVRVKNGNLFLNNKKLTEIQDSVFRDCNGNIIDFSEKTYKNIRLHIEP